MTGHHIVVRECGGDGSPELSMSVEVTGHHRVVRECGGDGSP